MSNRFRKKPVVIDAVQYKSPSYSNLREFVDSFGDNGNERIKVIRDEGLNITSSSSGGKLCIVTLEGNMEISNGDFLIRGVNGEFYPCKPDIFEKTYEAVN